MSHYFEFAKNTDSVPSTFMGWATTEVQTFHKITQFLVIVRAVHATKTT